MRNARLIVMDEPTAALSTAESERLFGIIRELSKSGIAVLYVSHRLDEILELCQRVTVFRDGRLVAELAGAGSDAPGAGRGDCRRRSRVAAKSCRDRPPLDEVAISVRRISRAPKVRSVSFDLKKGEVLGLGGLVGAGRSELARILFGADRPDSGEMTLEGQALCSREARPRP